MKSITEEDTKKFPMISGEGKKVRHMSGFLSCRYSKSGSQTDRRTDGRTDGQAGEQAGRQTDRQTDRQADRQAGGQAGRQTDRQTDRHAGGQAGEQAGRQAVHRNNFVRTHSLSLELTLLQIVLSSYFFPLLEGIHMDLFRKELSKG